MSDYFALCNLAADQGFDNRKLPYVATPPVVELLEHYTPQVATLRAENAKLREALQRIIDEQPNPKLPYGKTIVDIARAALAA